MSVYDIIDEVQRKVRLDLAREIDLDIIYSMLHGNLNPFQYIYVMHLKRGYKIKITKMAEPNCFQIDLFRPPSIKPSDRFFLTPDGPRQDDPTKNVKV